MSWGGLSGSWRWMNRSVYCGVWCMGSMVNETYNPEPIENDERGRVYSLQSGSGGYKASSETVAVDRQSDGTYTLKFMSPASVMTIEEGIEDGREAIAMGRREAGRRISVGMPGSGKIEVPDFDLDQIPSEPSE